ncbi:MAG TPA: NADPH dehydrogenase NamA [Clostridiales bacterium]|nr:NADPH dehydrogenase NamA [Clostridiales bacterium]
MKIFEKIEIKNLKLKNRIVMPPMCMYTAEEDGFVTPWHVNHYTTRAVGGVGLIMVEATAVEPSGRISANDLGIWSEDHIEGLKKIVDSVHQNGGKIGIQLAHAGRKSDSLKDEIYGPSPIRFNDDYRLPKEMTVEDIKRVKNNFKEAAARAEKAGFDLIEIHGAHGYLINEFISPLTNKREDEYGGSLENRSRFLKEILEEVVQVWPKEKPITLRVSSLEYSEKGNTSEDIADIINHVKESGVDIVNVSSGGVIYTKINPYPGYQIEPARIIKEKTNLPVMAGGLVTDWQLAEEIIKNKRGDMVYMGRKLLRDPYFVINASHQLGIDYPWPKQYERARI